MNDARDSAEDGTSRLRSSKKGAGWARRAVAALTRTTAELRPAIERDELIVYGQPVMDLRSGLVTGVESLVRWSHPQRGVLAAGEFLHVAESAGLMLPIERRVLRESCRIAASWVRALTTAPAVHVNISRHRLETENVQGEVLEALTFFGLDPSLLVLEIPHALVPRMHPRLRSELQELRARGVRIAIDDLGVGYSILTRKGDLPVDIIKIDIGFVSRSHHPSPEAKGTKTVFSIAEERGLDVMVKNVETQEQAHLLSDYGCRKAQGFFYSHPMAEPQLLNYLVGRRPGTQS